MRERSIVPATNLPPSNSSVCELGGKGLPHALELEASRSGVARSSSGSSMLDITQQRRLHLSLLKARPVISRRTPPSLSLEEEPLGLAEDLPRLFQLQSPLLEVLERGVHRLNARLGFGEARVEVVECLRA